jgi:hypothetical protein
MNEVNKCDCELNGEGCCSKCYDGPVTDLTDIARWEAHIKMEREAHESQEG